MEIQPGLAQTSLALPATPVAAQLPASATPPSTPAPGTQDSVEITVTMRVPAGLMTPGPDGVRPISAYQPTLLAPTAIVTNDAEIKSLVDTVRQQAAPPGTHTEFNDGAAGHLIEAAKQTLIRVSNSAGGLALYSLMWGGHAFGCIPRAVAVPLSMVGGAIGVVAGLEQTREALNVKNHYEGLKKQGEQTVDVSVPVRTPTGVRLQASKIGIDTAIQRAHDRVVLGGLQIGASALMLAAGATAFPPLAVASALVTAGSALYAARGQLAKVAEAAWNRLKHFCHADTPAPPATTPPAGSGGTAPGLSAAAVQPEQPIPVAPSAAPPA